MLCGRIVGRGPAGGSGTAGVADVAETARRSGVEGAGGRQSAPRGTSPSPPSGSDVDSGYHGLTNGKDTDLLPPSFVDEAAGDSDDGYTTSDAGGEEAPYHRLRTPSEAVAVSARRAAQRAIMEDID